MSVLGKESGPSQIAAGEEKRMKTQPYPPKGTPNPAGLPPLPPPDYMDPAIVSCGHDGCDAHRPAGVSATPSACYRHRPLPCRLGIHGHYSEEVALGEWYRRTCLVCGHSSTRDPSLMKGVEVHLPPPGRPPNDPPSP